jgi:hypothetical protein
MSLTACSPLARDREPMITWFLGEDVASLRELSKPMPLFPPTKLLVLAEMID